MAKYRVRKAAVQLDFEGNPQYQGLDPLSGLEHIYEVVKGIEQDLSRQVRMAIKDGKAYRHTYVVLEGELVRLLESVKAYGRYAPALNHSPEEVEYFKGIR